MKIVTIVGTRPQFIKAAAVTRAFARANDASPGRPIREVTISTGQHYDWELTGISFAELGWAGAHYELSAGSGPHGAQTARMLEQIERILIDEAPDTVLVYGDTNSTLAGALAAAKLHMPIAHVEAGLRSRNRRMPEEVNRVLTDHLSRDLFCPTPQAVANLAAEGIRDGVHCVGDVMHASACEFARAAGSRREILERLGLEPGGYALVTAHRAENTDDPSRLRGIVDALERIARECPIVWPVHPRTQKVLAALALAPRGVQLVPPCSYVDTLVLQRDARVVLTDSGGVQREAFWLSVPCITLRDETEWDETVARGWNRLAGADTAAIVDAFHAFTRGWQPPAPADPPAPTADLIVSILAGTPAASAVGPEG